MHAAVPSVKILPPTVKKFDTPNCRSSLSGAAFAAVCEGKSGCREHCLCLLGSENGCFMVFFQLVLRCNAMLLHTKEALFAS